MHTSTEQSSCIAKVINLTKISFVPGTETVFLISLLHSMSSCIPAKNLLHISFKKCPTYKKNENIFSGTTTRNDQVLSRNTAGCDQDYNLLSKTPFTCNMPLQNSTVWQKIITVCNCTIFCSCEDSTYGINTFHLNLSFCSFGLVLLFIIAFYILHFPFCFILNTFKLIYIQMWAPMVISH